MVGLSLPPKIRLPQVANRTHVYHTPSAASRTEQFANNAQATLVANILPDDSSFQVTDAGFFPTTGNFAIIIDGEIIKVGVRDGNWFSTLVRGDENTARASHSAGATVTHILSARSYVQGINDRVGTNTGSGTSAMELLESHTITSPTATMDFTSRNATGKSGAPFQDDYRTYLLIYHTMSPVTNGVNLVLRYSSDGGSSYYTSNNYYGEYWAVNNGGGSGAYTFNAISVIPLHAGSDHVGNGDIGTSGTCYFLNPRSVLLPKQCMIDAVYRASAGNIVRGMGHGYFDAANTTAMNAFRLFMDSGNINYGSAELYGIK